MNVYIQQKELMEVIDMYENEIRNYQNLSKLDVFKLTMKCFSSVFDRFFKPYILQHEKPPFEYRLFLEPIWEGLNEAFEKYDVSKNVKITTFIYSKVYYRLLNFWNKTIDELERWNKCKSFDSISIWLREPQASQIISGKIRKQLIRELENDVISTGNQNLISTLFMTRQEYDVETIASTMKVHRKSVHRWLKKIIEIGKKIIKRKGWK